MPVITVKPFFFFNSDKSFVKFCGNVETFFKVNLRLTYGRRSICKGANSKRVLCGFKNLPRNLTKSSKYTKNAVKEVEEQKTVAETVSESK